MMIYWLPEVRTSPYPVSYGQVGTPAHPTTGGFTVSTPSFDPLPTPYLTEIGMR